MGNIGIENLLGKLFKTDEVKESKSLQYVYWALFVGFLISFNTFMNHKVGDTTKLEGLEHVCPSYFQSCDLFYFLTFLPHSYSGNIFYAVLFGLLAFSGYFALLKRWNLSFLFLLPPTLWKITAAFLIEDRISVPFEYFHLGYLLVLMFFSNKVNLLRHLLVVMYFCSGLVKIHEAWIVGNYFTALNLGMPLVPNSLVPIATNFIIVLELLTPVLLLSNNLKIKKITFFTYVIFHIYSVSLVGFRYPIHCLPILIFLFFPLERTVKKNINIRFSMILFSILIVNFYPFTLRGDHKVSYQGIRFAVSMFDSNRQCESKKTLTLLSGDEVKEIKRSLYSRIRCAPYWDWFKINLQCASGKYRNIAWDLNISLNGNPFYSVVSSKNACDLEFKAFRDNLWIKSDFLKKNIIGFPQKNSYYGPYFNPKTKIVYDKATIELTKFQKGIKSVLSYIKTLYFIIVFCSLLIYFFRFHLSFKSRK